MDWLRSNWKRISAVVAALLALSGWGLHAYQALRDGKPIPVPPAIEPIESQPPVVTLPGPMTGWVDDPDEVAAVVATLPIKAYRDTPAFAEAAAPDHVFAWEAAQKALKADIPTRDQRSVGACTAFGTDGAVEYLQVAQIVQALQAGRPPPVWKELAQEVTYGLARVQILGGRIRGDGATGASTAQASQRYGVLARGKYGSEDLTAYSESTCRRYGQSGPPASLLPEIAKHKVAGITQAKSTDELRSALANGYMPAIASSVGFGQSGPYVRDADGVLRASGTWNHQMHVIGYAKHPTRGWLYCIMNSWGGKWVSGPRGAGNPPPGSFWCVEDAMQRILNAADSWIYSDFAGFPARKLDWLIVAPRPRERLALRNEPVLSW